MLLPLIDIRCNHIIILNFLRAVQPHLEVATLVALPARLNHYAVPVPTRDGSDGVFFVIVAGGPGSTHIVSFTSSTELITSNPHEHRGQVIFFASVVRIICEVCNELRDNVCLPGGEIPFRRQAKGEAVEACVADGICIEFP